MILRLFLNKSDILIMQQNYFNDLYSEYSAGEIERSEFEGLIYRYFINHQSKTNIAHWKKAEYEDFVSWFYPRLRKAIDSYCPKNISFDSYIKKIWSVSAKEYRVRITINSVTEYSAWSIQVPELYAHEETPVYTCENRDDVLSKLIFDYKGRKNPKQLLALILKCYCFVSDDFIDRIAPKLDMDGEKLKAMVDKLRETRRTRDDELYLMRERIYCQFYRCIVYEKRLVFLQENTHAWSILKNKLVKARERLEKMRIRLSKIRTDATNKEIANVIGTSKGSVDAGLHRLKVKWDILNDKTLLN